MTKQKYKSRDQYRPEFTETVRATLLEVATRLGDLMPEIRVVGGLVPTLLIPQESLSGEAAHVGTTDLDVGLELSLLSEERYKTVTERLRDANFAPDETPQGRATKQTWRNTRLTGVSIDFLIPPSLPGDQGGKLRNLEPDFAAIIAPGLNLAFQDFDRIRIEGRTLAGEHAARDVWVCGAGAFLVLKALAFGGPSARGEEKDAYDLFYLLANYGKGVEDVHARLAPLLSDPMAQEALRVLQRDFSRNDGTGPRRVASFLTKGTDDQIQADAVGFAGELVRLCERRA